MSKLLCIVTNCQRDAAYVLRGNSLCEKHYRYETGTTSMTPKDSNDALDELDQILSIIVSGLKPKDIVEATEKYIKYRIKQLQDSQEQA